MHETNYKITHYYGGVISNELENIWASLTQQILRPFFIHDVHWFKAYLASHPQSSASCHIFSLSFNDQVIALFPMQYVEIRRFGLPLRAWQIFWPNDMGINDFIIATPSDYHHYLRLLMTRLNKLTATYPWDLLELENILDDAVIANAISNDPVSRCISVDHHYSKFLTCNSNYEASVANVSAKFKKNNRRKRRNLEKLGHVTTGYYSSPDELDIAFEQFLDVEAANWKSHNGTALRCDTRQCRFYQALIAEHADSGRCVIHTLNLDGNPIAAQLALIYGDTFYLLKIGYDDKYQAMGPGCLLLEETIRRFSGDAHIKRISFITGAKWNDDWAPQVNKVYHHYIYNATARGLLCWSVDKTKSGLRLIKRMLFKQASQQ